MKLTIRDLTDSFINIVENVDSWIVFMTTGLILPFSILFYRSWTILCEVSYIFPEFVFLSMNNVFLEPFFLCYFLSFVSGFFLHKKRPSFHQKCIVKSGPLLKVYSKMIEAECIIAEKKSLGFVLVIFYFYFYVLVCFRGYTLEVIFLFFRQVFLSYLAFKVFFQQEYKKKESIYKYVFCGLPFYRRFLFFFEKSETKKVDITLLYSVCSLVFICLFRENIRIEADIKERIKECLFLLNSLEKKGCADVYMLEKEKLFTFKEKKGLFFFVGLHYMTDFSQKSQVFLKKLEDCEFL